jgi:hypothetical protein
MDAMAFRHVSAPRNWIVRGEEEEEEEEGDQRDMAPNAKAGQ